MKRGMRPAIIPEPKKWTLTGGELKLAKVTAGKNAAEAVRMTETINECLGREAYHMHITTEGIAIEGGSRIGLLYAKSTLEQLKLQYVDTVPCMEIEDEPASEYRSFHLDSSRHFIPIEELKKMITMCAHFKLNTFHWHFADDQGWRIESKAYPLLHEIGAKRAGDHFGRCRSDVEEHDYYTREQVKELVAFCENLGVQVVPEIDIPGHVTAILAAYPKLSCKETKVEVATGGGIYTDILCPGKEETFQFLENLLDDLLELFPGKYFHIGGDETPKQNWKSCPHCQKRMEEEHLENAHQLQGYFQNRIAAYLKTKGRTAIVWNEAALGGNLDTDIVIQLWNDGRELGKNRIDGIGKAHLEKGGKVIIANMMNSYCDYPYAFISLKNVYELPWAPSGMTVDKLTEENKKQILGNECLLWTENIRKWERLETRAWPRFAAAAEMGWCREAHSSYEDFEERMKRIFPIFEKYGIVATKASGWVPNSIRKMFQFIEMASNFSINTIGSFIKQQEEI